MPKPDLSIELFNSNFESELKSSVYSVNFEALFEELGIIILKKEVSVSELLAKQELDLQIEVSFVSVDFIKDINFQTRTINEPTDVLSFPNFSFEIIQKSKSLKKCEIEDLDFEIEPYAWLDPSASKGKISLGEIIICPLKAKEQAADLGHSIAREISFLFMHGMLHLMGYDHQDEDDEKMMFGLQKLIIPDLDSLVDKYKI